MSWTKAIVIVLAVFIGWQALQRVTGSSARLGSTSIGDEELRTLAASVKDGDVQMYTTTDCPYCGEARAWLREYGFTFTECDAQVHERCATELAERGIDGVPYLIVRGQPLSVGFDSDEFIAAAKNLNN